MQNALVCSYVDKVYLFLFCTSCVHFLVALTRNSYPSTFKKVLSFALDVISDGSGVWFIGTHATQPLCSPTAGQNESVPFRQHSLCSYNYQDAHCHQCQCQLCDLLGEKLFERWLVKGQSGMLSWFMVQYKACTIGVFALVCGLMLRLPNVIRRYVFVSMWETFIHATQASWWPCQALSCHNLCSCPLWSFQADCDK